MNIYDEYQELAGRTDGNKELDYYCSQICCEAGELLNMYVKTKYHNHALDLVNLKEEVGDLLWFAARLAHRSNISFSNLVLESSQVSNMVYGYNVLYLSSYEISKLLYRIGISFMDESMYHEEKRFARLAPTGACSETLLVLIKVILELINREKLDIKEILSLNIDKLVKRYPEGYTDYNSINRNPDKELENF